MLSAVLFREFMFSVLFVEVKVKLGNVLVELYQLLIGKTFRGCIIVDNI